MPRPKKFRRINFMPEVTFFKPAGVQMRDLQEVFISYDEFEAIRLKDVLNFSQEQGAKEMGISQPTFHRLLQVAHKKIADALVNGYALRIETVKQEHFNPHGQFHGRQGNGPRWK